MSEYVRIEMLKQDYTRNRSSKILFSQECIIIISKLSITLKKATKFPLLIRYSWFFFPLMLDYDPFLRNKIYFGCTLTSIILFKYINSHEFFFVTIRLLIVMLLIKCILGTSGKFACLLAYVVGWLCIFKITHISLPPT